MTSLRRGALVVALVAVVASAAAPPGAAAPARIDLPTATWTYGRSTQDRPLTVTRRGFAPDDVVDVLVVGVVHGNETAGLDIVRALQHGGVPPHVRLWIVPSANPDGQQRRARQNARGVDLNRNFPFQWRGGGQPWDVYYPGAAAGSEAETRVVQRLVTAVRPDVTIWYHQHLDMVLRPSTPQRVAVARAYAYASGMRLRNYPGGHLFGTAVSWQSAVQPAGAAFVVELPAGRLSAAAVRRHARAVRLVGSYVHGVQAAAAAAS